MQEHLPVYRSPNRAARMIERQDRDKHNKEFAYEPIFHYQFCPVTPILASRQSDIGFLILVARDRFGNRLRIKISQYFVDLHIEVCLYLFGFLL